MPRKFLDNIRATLASTLVTGGETTAPELAAIMLDIIDSSIQDEAIIASNVASPSIPTTTEWVALTTGIYDQEAGADGQFLLTDFAAGTVSAGSQAGFTYNVRGLISFQDLQNGRSISFVILQNGLPVGFISNNTGLGGGKSVTAFIEFNDISTASNSVFQIAVQTTDGANTVNIQTIALTLVIQPTNNP